MCTWSPIPRVSSYASFKVDAYAGRLRISVLKRRHGLSRCRYRGLDGIKRWVGFGVIADNLVSIR